MIDASKRQYGLIAVYAMTVSETGEIRTELIPSDLRERLGGPTPVLLSSDSWPLFVHADDLETVRAAIATMWSTGEFHATYRAGTADGHYVWLDDRLRFEFGGTGDPGARTGIGYAATPTAPLCANPEDDSAEMFCAALTHELGQLLTTIGFSAETLPSIVGDWDGPAGLSEALMEKTDRIRSSAQRAKRVIRGLHDVIRNQGGLADTVDLRQVVDTAVHYLPPLHVPVLVSMPGKLAVQGNAVLLELAVTNILKNAREAILRHSWGELDDASHRIEIEAVQSSDYVELRITDTGGGLAGSVDRAFSRGVTTKPDKAAHGVGLWLVRRIAEHHDGKVVLRNTGRGLEVSLLLPQIRARDAA